MPAGMPADKPGRSIMDIGEDGRWMTYDELAQARGIDRQSARRMANRAHWRRQKDNSGIVRVCVPLAQTARHRRQRDMPAGKPAGVPAVQPVDVTAVIKPLEVAIASLTEARNQAEARADRAEARADALQARLEAAEEAATRYIKSRSLGRLARLRAAWQGE